MEQEKQIDEMARTAIEALPIFNAKNYNVIYQMCEHLYNAGYRKVSDVVAEFIAEIEKIIEVDKFGVATFDIRELYKIEQKYKGE